MTPAHEWPEALASLLPADLLPLCRPRGLARGAPLFAAGGRPAQLFWVAWGEVVLERPGRDGQGLVLQRCRQGFVAEASLQAARYHCDARALTASQVLAVPLAPLRVALAGDAAFANRWVQMLNGELRRLRLQCERLALPRVQDRLLHLIDTEGVQGRWVLTGDLKSLAATLGVTHEALYRTMAALEKAGRLRREVDALVLPG